MNKNEPLTRPKHPVGYDETLSDEDLYKALWRDCGNTLCNDWAYRYEPDSDLFVDKKDKHEWYRGDEVRMLRYLAKQRRN
jgi:hypothetical protein